MGHQKKYTTYSKADIWPNESEAQPLPPGAVSVNAPTAADLSPPSVDSAIIQRGRERFNIFCAPCHGFDGKGDGIIVHRGFPAPPSYHTDRLRKAPAQHFYDVITNGYGVMYSYAARVPPSDRWAIIAYIRALQLSQDPQLADGTSAAEQPK